jgi:hypothetical protein
VLGPNTPAVDVIAAVGRVDHLRAVGVSVGSDAAEESAPRTLVGVWDGFPEVPLLRGGPGVPDGSPPAGGRVGHRRRPARHPADRQGVVGAGREGSKRQGRHLLAGT